MQLMQPLRSVAPCPSGTKIANRCCLWLFIITLGLKQVGSLEVLSKATAAKPNIIPNVGFVESNFSMVFPGAPPSLSLPDSDLTQFLGSFRPSLDSNSTAPVELSAESTEIPISWTRIYIALGVVLAMVTVSFLLASPPGQRAAQCALPDSQILETFLVSSLGAGMYVAYFMPIALQLQLMEWLDISFTQYSYLDGCYMLLAMIALICIPGWVYDRHPFHYQLVAGIVAICGVLLSITGIISKSHTVVVCGFAILGAAGETFLVSQDTLIANYFTSTVASSFGLQYAALDCATAFSMFLVFMGVSVLDCWLIGVVACSCSLLASVVLSALLSRPERKEAEEMEAQSSSLKSPRSRNATYVTVLIAIVGITQYASISAAGANSMAATQWAFGTSEDQTAQILAITFVLRSILGILFGFTMDAWGSRSKMCSIIIITCVDALTFVLFALKWGHPLPIWIILQTSDNMLQSCAYSLLAVLHKGDVGRVYKTLNAIMYGCCAAMALLQGTIVDASDGSFQAAFFVHAVALLICVCLSAAAQMLMGQDKAMTSYLKNWDAEAELERKTPPVSSRDTA